MLKLIYNIILVLLMANMINMILERHVQIPTLSRPLLLTLFTWKAISLSNVKGSFTIPQFWQNLALWYGTWGVILIQMNMVIKVATFICIQIIKNQHGHKNHDRHKHSFVEIRITLMNDKTCWNEAVTRSDEVDAAENWFEAFKLKLLHIFSPMMSV